MDGIECFSEKYQMDLVRRKYINDEVKPVCNGTPSHKIHDRMLNLFLNNNRCPIASVVEHSLGDLKNVDGMLTAINTKYCA